MVRKLLAIALFVFVLLPVVAFAETPAEPTVTIPENPLMLCEIYPGVSKGTEFVEVYNNTGDTLTLTGYIIVITSTDSGTQYEIDLSSETLAPDEYRAIIDLVGDVYNFSLANSGATVELKYTVANLELTLASITYTELDDDFSWSFINDEWVVGLPSANLPNLPVPVEEEPEVPACEADGVLINEVLPNPAGSDTAGGEFVELYNTSAQPVNLTGCVLKTDKLPELQLTDITIEPNGFAVIELLDDLLNSGGNVWLIKNSSEEIVEYGAVGDDEAWARFAEGWEQTDVPTPGTANQKTPEEPEPVTVGLAPCPAGKFRNPETNRCKNIADTASALLPCDPGESRNPATNRCRKITSLASLTPCKPGQERNPATNRCRKISSASQLAPCQPGYERNPDTNRCRKSTSGVAGAASFATTSPSELHNGLLIAAAGLALIYGAWEYRRDLANWLAKLRSN